jgi:transcription factor 1
MTLLDFQPKALYQALRQKGNDYQYDYFEQMLGSLFIQPTKNIVEALESLAPGASEALIPQCPSLSDPNAGGMRDLHKFRVRLLNEKMLEELAEAWIKWPFRPSKAEMMVRMRLIDTDFEETIEEQGGIPLDFTKD